MKTEHSTSRPIVKRLFLFVSLLAVSCAVGSAACGQPRVGLLPTKEQTYGLFKSQPQTRFVDKGVFEVWYETSQPTPPAIVYFGINDITEQLDYPRYRKSTREQGGDLELRTEHAIRVDYASLLRSMPNTEYEPRICWRLELYLPWERSTRFIEGRRYFNPDTLGDTANVTMGPLVDQVTKTSAVISFETDRPVVGSLVVDGRMFVSGEVRKHEFLVEGLKPNSQYDYQVKAGDTVVRPYSFETAGSEVFQFAAMVDSREGVGGGLRNYYGVNAFSLYALASDAYFRGAEFIVFPGDLINGYTTSEEDFRGQLDSYRRTLAPVHARIPIFEGMGNHEALTNVYLNGAVMDRPGDQSAEAVFADVFTNPTNGPHNEGHGSPTYDENVYFFDHAHARIFVLNNNYWWSRDPHRDGGNLEGYVLPQQIKWLRAEVAKADQDDRVRLLFFAAQEPPFPNGGHTRDAMWYNGGDTNRDGKVDDQDIKIVENRNELWEIVASSSKTVAFITGDEHAYSRVRIGEFTDVGHKRKLDGSTAVFGRPVWQVTSGGAGAPWYDKELHLPWSSELAAHSTQPHYAYFQISGDRVDLSVFSQTGEKIDSAVLKSASSE